MSSLHPIQGLNDVVKLALAPKYTVLLGGMPHTPDLRERADYLLGVLGASWDEHDGWQPVRPRRSPESRRREWP
jgi:hypothetical protein